MLQLPALESLIAKFVVRTPLLRSLVAPVSNWYMGATTARKYGLTYDDVIMEENPTMQEVLHRLPAETKSLREFRYKRAIQASLMKNYLGPEEHVRPEQDKPYLQHLLAEVRHEEEERAHYDLAQRK